MPTYRKKMNIHWKKADIRDARHWMNISQLSRCSKSRTEAKVSERGDVFKYKKAYK